MSFTTNSSQELPLLGRIVVITRAHSQSSNLKERLESLGGHVIEFPVIMTEPSEERGKIYQTLRELNTYDWIVFSSANGVKHTVEFLLEMNLNAKYLEQVRIATIGPGTETALKQHDIKADLIPEREYVGEGMLKTFQEALPSFEGKRFLILQADIAREDLAVALRDKGAYVEQLTVYKTVITPEGAEQKAILEALIARSVDVITFTSPSTVINFGIKMDKELKENPGLLEGVLLASIGPVTGETLLKKFGHIDIEAAIHTEEGLIDAIEAYYLDNKIRLPL